MRSRRQPAGVHERSRTFDVSAFDWTDDRWTGRQLPGSVVYAPTPAAELRLITCGGPFDPVRGSYRDNVVVSAELIG